MTTDQIATRSDQLATTRGPVGSNERGTSEDNQLEVETVRFGDAYRHGFHIQVMGGPYGIDKGVYMSTFQVGRGQHITSLTHDQARDLGMALIRAAEAAKHPSI